MPHSLKQNLFITLGIFLLALLPRVYPNPVLTYDENTFWVRRSEVFRASIINSDWESTMLTAHPGITTMWLGAAGIAIDNIINESGHSSTNYVGYVNTIRIPMAVFNALCVAGGYLLLLRFFDYRIAALGAILWATDPFIIAHSHILHTDAPVMSLMTLAIWSGLIAFRLDAPSPRATESLHWGFLVLSGVLVGLASLSKISGFSTALILFLVVFTVKRRELSHFRWVRRLITPLIAWSLIALLTWIVVWPATVLYSREVLDLVIYGFGVAAEAHQNFLLGEATSSPGIAYYPVSIALRITPWLTIGVPAAIIAAVQEQNQKHRRLVVSSLIFVLIFVTLLSLQPKKFDRYALPIFPTLNVLAALGLGWFIQRWIRQRPSLVWNWKHKCFGWGICLAILTFNVVWYFPYFLAYYNPLLGGGDTAERAIFIGWGEGLGLAADYVRMHSGQSCNHQITASWGETLTNKHLPCSTFLPLNGETISKLGDNGYIILYINQVQRPWSDAIVNSREVIEIVEGIDPLYAVHIHGIEYAWIYHTSMLEDHIARKGNH